MILERLRAWRRRREHIRQEQQALNAMPRLNIDGSRLRPLTRRALDELFRSPAVNAEWPEMKASFDRIATIEDGKTGGVNPGDRRALYFLVRALRPRRVLEIGTHVGASTMYIAAALKKNGAAPGDGAFITVDIHDINAPDADWRRAGLPRSPRDSLVQLGAADGVQIITMPALRYFDQVDKPFDLIFLDGDHSAAAVYQEISCALAYLRDGGTVVIHDFFPKQRPLWNDGEMVAGPSLAAQRCRRDGSGIVERPLGALPCVTSLALLTRR